MKRKRPEDVGMTMEEYAESAEEEVTDARAELAARGGFDVGPVDLTQCRDQLVYGLVKGGGDRGHGLRCRCRG